MNPNTGQPIQDPKLINPSAQDPATALTSEQKAIQAEQELQQWEQGLGDIFGNEELSPTATVVPSQVSQEQISQQAVVIPTTNQIANSQNAVILTQEESLSTEQEKSQVNPQVQTQSVVQPTTPQTEQQPVPVQTIEQPIQVAPKSSMNHKLLI